MSYARANEPPRGDVPAQMDADRARTLAERLHHGQRHRDGTALIEHVRRVASAVPGDARVVAWLHEALEHTAIAEEALLADGVSLDELRAIRLLTRDLALRSDETYLAHVERVARARGPGADLARAVKRADLADRAHHAPGNGAGWSPPYGAALDVLQDGAARLGGGAPCRDAPTEPAPIEAVAASHHNGRRPSPAARRTAGPIAQEGQAP
jgi:hypothetical protein